MAKFEFFDRLICGRPLKNFECETQNFDLLTRGHEGRKMPCFDPQGVPRGHIWTIYVFSVCLNWDSIENQKKNSWEYRPVFQIGIPNFVSNFLEKFAIIFAATRLIGNYDFFPTDPCLNRVPLSGELLRKKFSKFSKIWDFQKSIAQNFGREGYLKVIWPCGEKIVVYGHASLNSVWIRFLGVFREKVFGIPIWNIGRYSNFFFGGKKKNHFEYRSNFRSVFHFRFLTKVE